MHVGGGLLILLLLYIYLRDAARMKSTFAGWEALLKLSGSSDVRETSCG